MSDFRTLRGFEELWRSPLQPLRRPPHVIVSLGGSTADEARARLARIANSAPEVFVKLTGRPHDRRSLRAQLDYISRRGEVELEDRDGNVIIGRPAARELADDWSALAQIDSRRQSNTPFGMVFVLAMPPPTDAAIVRDAARAFARELFAEQFDYAFALHTDTRHPHVHLAVRRLGDQGQRLITTPADLMNWRQIFARALRDRGVEAEATPRGARGVTRRPEPTPLRRMRERHEAGHGELPKVLRAAYHEAAKVAFMGETDKTPWEMRLVERQTKARALYLAQAELLRRSPDPVDQALGSRVEAFVRKMPAPDSRRLALARELRALRTALNPERDAPQKDRSR